MVTLQPLTSVVTHGNTTATDLCGHNGNTMATDLCGHTWSHYSHWPLWSHMVTLQPLTSVVTMVTLQPLTSVVTLQPLTSVVTMVTLQPLTSVVTHGHTTATDLCGHNGDITATDLCGHTTATDLCGHNGHTTATDLCGHDETGCCWVDGDVTSHQANVLELFKEFPVLLVAQSLDGGRVDHSLFVSQGHRHGVPATWSRKSIPTCPILNAACVVLFSGCFLQSELHKLFCLLCLWAWIFRCTELLLLLIWIF